MKKITGAQIMIKCLEEEGVEVIFGYPGAAVMPIYDNLLNSDIRHILVRHEQGAAHAADGYARATGRTGVCLVTSGPGVTNLITGIANANVDSIPIVAITGQVAIDKIGTDAFQETDTIGITSPITKHNYLVKDVKELPKIIKEAFYIASTGRQGPVVIDIPIDIQNSLVNDNVKTKLETPGYKPTYKGNANQIRQAAGIIHRSNKPVLLAGGGIISAGASDILTKFVRNAKIPVINSLMGLGCFPADDKLSLGMAGVCGSIYANKTLSVADLIIAVGIRFDGRITGKISKFAPNAKIIHIDLDPAEIGKNIIPSIPIVGDARNILEDLFKEYEKIPDKDDTKREKWLNEVDELKNKYLTRNDNDTNKLTPSYIIETINEITKGDAIICTEVGQHQMWVAQFYKFTQPRTFISSGGLGAMGFGLPAAIGAKVGRPDKTVIDIAGDGSIQMVAQELATAVSNKIPVKIMVLNNGYLGMVRQLQQVLCDGRYSGVCINNSVDFVMLAKAYGASGFRVREKKEVKSIIKKALETENVTLIDFLIDREEDVYPMEVYVSSQVRADKKVENINHIISVLVENKAGVLAKVSGLFRRRGYNIDSVSVGTTEDEKFSTITMVVSGKKHSIEQVIKQLYKLINVIKIKELDPFNDVEKELVLIKVNTNSTKRKEIMEIVNIFEADIIDVEKKSILVCYSGSGRKIKTIEELLMPFGILELVRSGKVACARTK